MRRFGLRALAGLVPVGCVLMLFQAVGLSDRVAAAIHLSDNSPRGIVAVAAESLAPYRATPVAVG
jgi:hypothetical protein